MKKLVILSDSHSDVETVQLIMDRHRDEADAFIHCGDSELPSDHPLLADMHVVLGNCDWGATFPKEKNLEIDGVKLLVTHGHLYNVKMSLMNLSFKAREVGAQLVCFGHSHEAGVEKIDDILFVNPGSVSLPRKRTEPTYCIATLSYPHVTVQLNNVDGSELEKVCYTL